MNSVKTRMTISILQTIAKKGFYADLIADDLIKEGATIPVRCKDCKYSKFLSYCSKYECLRHDERIKYADDYCNFGERKKE